MILPVSTQQGRPEEEARLRSLWNFVARNRLLTLGVPLLVVAATVVLVYVVSPVYEASTWIRIDEERSNVAVLDALSALSAGTTIGTELEVLRRRPLSEEVVDSLQLQMELQRPRRTQRSELFGQVEVDRDARPGRYSLRRAEDGRYAVHYDPAEEELGRFAIGEPVVLNGLRLELLPGASEHEEIRFQIQEFEEAVDRFRGRLRVSRPERDADLLVVRYTGRDPELVHAVPNAMARYFIRQRQTVQKAEARSAVSFLNEQIDTLAGQLRQAEEALRTFREEEQALQPETDAEIQISRLSELLARRDLLEAEREGLAELYAEVMAAAPDRPGGRPPYRRLINFPTLLSNFAVSELFRSMADVEGQRAALLERRTPADPEVQVLTGRIMELEDQLGDIAGTYLQGLTNQVASLDTTLAEFGRELQQLPAREVELARLGRQTEVLDEVYVVLLTRLKEAEITAAVDDPSVRVVEPAIFPLEPIRPNKPLSVLLALVLGIVLGAGVAFAREHMDDTVHTREDLQRTMDGIPVLGHIPRIREAVSANGRNGKRRQPATNPLEQSRLVVGRDPRNPVSEAYRSLRTNITFINPERTPRTLVFTSPTPGDGKSTSSSNLAITLVQQGQRCLLIDADMRRGVLQSVFGTAREPGLSNVLLGRAEPADAIRAVDLGESGTMDFMPTGTLPPNPAELLGSTRMRALLEQLEERYDAIILDAPPLNVVTDAALLGTSSDGVLVVARAGVTERAGLEYAIEQLRAVRAPVLGSVLNDIDARRDRYYGSYAAAAHYRYELESGSDR